MYPDRNSNAEMRLKTVSQSVFPCLPLLPFSVCLASIGAIDMISQLSR